MTTDFEALLDAMDGVALVIDRDLKIQSVGIRNWQAFWCENGGTRPDDAQIIGRTITDAFTPGSVRNTFRQMFADLFAGQRASLRLDYRCDAPNERRVMRLSVTPIRARDQGEIRHLLYQSVLIDSEQRPPLALFGAPATGLKRPDILRICCVCAKVATPAPGAEGQQQWLDAEDYYAQGGQEVSMLSHGFCEPCATKLLADDRAVGHLEH
ncbi:MAG: hypothetical protein JJU27_11910 [Gammaproteobacteria bacterium]|nr:hypothetical protein [Gammaproteobacteria bacterium]